MLRTLDSLGELLRTKVSSDVAIACATADTIDGLTDLEARLVSDWHPSRRAQFAAGRRAARRALAIFGVGFVDIPFDQDGVPIWPRGFVGSISHKREACIAAAAPSTWLEFIGIDLERDRTERPSDEEELLKRVCPTPAERLLVADLRNDFRSPATAVLSMKEAIFKAHFPVTRSWINWDDVQVTLTGRYVFHGRTIDGGIQCPGGVLVYHEGWIAAIVTGRAV